MSATPKGMVCRVDGSRLAYYLRAADEEFWDRRWTSSEVEERMVAARQGHLGTYAKWFDRYLPKSGKLVEAGCGLGQYVVALRQRGFDVEGVEWARNTVGMLNDLYPEVPIRAGDVSNLDADDGYYSGYISLGVVEHRQQGPEPFLDEAYRVLQPGGVAIFTVPYINVIRKTKRLLGLYHSSIEGREFYQYAFSRREFVALLGQAGFRVEQVSGCDSYKGIFDELAMLSWVKRMRLGRYDVGALVQRGLEKFPWIES
ncbi:MAG: class I SAM-dependent methyltransferase, partial [Gammaproteobacteria bacterium]|nr:class I SAM-dependent methyltransferase [Gammaproteobacteria bacterium]